MDRDSNRNILHIQLHSARTQRNQTKKSTIHITYAMSTFMFFVRVVRFVGCPFWTAYDGYIKTIHNISWAVCAFLCLCRKCEPKRLDMWVKWKLYCYVANIVLCGVAADHVQACESIARIGYDQSHAKEPYGAGMMSRLCSTNALHRSKRNVLGQWGQAKKQCTMCLISRTRAFWNRKRVVRIVWFMSIPNLPIVADVSMRTLVIICCCRRVIFNRYLRNCKRILCSSFTYDIMLSLIVVCSFASVRFVSCTLNACELYDECIRLPKWGICSTSCVWYEMNMFHEMWSETFHLSTKVVHEHIVCEYLHVDFVWISHIVTPSTQQRPHLTMCLHGDKS